MRFLLNTRSAAPIIHHVKKSAVLGSVASGEGKVVSAEPKTSSATPHSSAYDRTIGSDQHHVLSKSWGQQCSVNCGCIVRFETEVDPSTDTVKSSTYYAKSVVASLANNQLKPHYTVSRKKKPKALIKKCNCQTLHVLASKVTHFLPKQRMSKLFSMLEYENVRSSDAFRYTVLKENNLPTNDSHCFDLIEAAVTAMIRGYMPISRNTIKNLSDRKHEVHDNGSTLDENGTFDFSKRKNSAMTQRGSGYGIDQSSTSVANSPHMSALYMLDHQNYDDIHYHYQHHQPRNVSETNRKTIIADWESYVDEIYHFQEQEKRLRNQEESSA